MKKALNSYIVIWAILLVLFNVIAFVTPATPGELSKFDGAFWSGYIFITLAFIGQLAVGFIVFKSENSEKLFYNIPLLKISRTGLIITAIVGAFCMAIPKLPNWVGIIVCFIVLAFTAIAAVKASLAADVISEIDDKIKVQTFFIKSLTIDAESLLARAKSDVVKAECKKVYEAVRYSDPMSNAALSSLESEITVKFTKFSYAVNDDNSEAVTELATELVILIGDRNKKCKLLK